MERRYHELHNVRSDDGCDSGNATGDTRPFIVETRYEYVGGYKLHNQPPYEKTYKPM